MKKLIASILVLLVALSCMTCAFATRAQYANTKTVVEMLDDKNIVYTLKGVDEKNRETLTIKYAYEHYDYTVRLFFFEDNENISVRVWNVVDYDPARFDEVLETVNKLNYDYRFVKFCANTTDNSVTASMDLVVREGADVDEVVDEALDYATGITELGYDALSTFAK